MFEVLLIGVLVFGALSSFAALAAVVTGNRSLRRDSQRMLAEFDAQHRARLVDAGTSVVVTLNARLDHIEGLLGDIATQLSIASDTRETQFFEREQDLLDRILTLTHPNFIREFRRPPITQPRRPEDLSPQEVAAAVQKMSLGLDDVKGTVNGDARRRIHHPGYEGVERPEFDARNLREPRIYGPRPKGEQGGAAAPAPAAPTAPAASGVAAESFEQDSATSPEAAVAALTPSS